MTKTIRVLVVDDSLTVRKHLVDAILADSSLEVLGEAADGQTAVQHCLRLRPDVVTLDMMLPVMSGLAATEQIMAFCPTPILIVSASTNRGGLFSTYDALAAGAVDVLDKATGVEGDEAWASRLRAAIKLVARIKVITHPRARLTRSGPSVVGPRGADTGRVIALGASTGGPGAVAQVLQAIPAPCPLPILIVLHIGRPFGAALADWLDTQSSHRVSVAEEGISLAEAANRVWMAPPERHLVVRGGSLHLTLDPERHSCRPSVDVLFESLAVEIGAGCAACLMTGMGRDGAAGLLAIRSAGGTTMAQDEATSVVYGMPREAALLGAAGRILPLGEIGGALAAIPKPAPWSDEK